METNKPTVLKKVHSTFYDFKINSRYFTSILLFFLYSHFTITWHYTIIRKQQPYFQNVVDLCSLDSIQYIHCNFMKCCKESFICVYVVLLLRNSINICTDLRLNMSFYYALIFFFSSFALFHLTRFFNLIFVQTNNLHSIKFLNCS